MLNAECQVLNAKCALPNRKCSSASSRQAAKSAAEMKRFGGFWARLLKSRARELFSDEFEVCVKPDLRFIFALPGAERSPIACPTCALQVLGIAPDTDCRGSGCVILVWLHVLSNGKPQ